MALFRHLAGGLRVLLRRDSADRDLDAELRHYAEEAGAALNAGETLRIREQVRDASWEHLVDVPLVDIRYAVRRLRHDASFALVIVSTLALGIGGAAAIFSAVYPILLAPLPYPGARRIVAVSDRGADGSAVDVTFGTYRELAVRSRAFEALAVTKPWQPTLTGGEVPERLDGERASAAYFRVLGVRPAIGREFTSAEDERDGPRVVAISDRLGRRRFGADPAAVGRIVPLDGQPFTIVAVMPPTFQVVQLPTADIWTPLQYDQALPPDGREWGHHLRMFGRLRAGVTLLEARGDVDVVARTPVAEFRRVPWASMRQGLSVTALHADVVRGVQPALVALMSAVVLVLLAACVNVAMLLLARGWQRAGEIAMRAALGASRRRIVCQLVTESLVLAFAGGAAGLVVAVIGVRALVAAAPAGLPRVDAIRVDAVTLTFAVLVSALVGVLVGIIPAWHATDGGSRGRIRKASRAVTGRRAGTGALAAAEIALAVVLVVVAGLLVRSMQRLFAVDPGFDPAGVLTLQVRATTGLEDRARTREYFQSALAAVRGLPGVRAAGWTSEMPLTDDFEKYGVQIESNGDVDTAGDQSALRYAVTPGYFEAMKLQLRRGRWLDERDRIGAPAVALVSESFVRRRLGGREPLGQRVRISGRTDLPWFSIVGVVADVKQTSLAVDAGDAVYVTVEQWNAPERVLALAVRTDGNPEALAGAVRSAIWAIDRNQAVVRVATLRALVADSAAQRRFALLIFECFALAALALAATGIYGVMSASVTERQREIGVRAALGASRRELLALIFRDGMTLAVAGVSAGGLLAAAAGRSITSLLFAVSPFDAPTYAAAALLLALVAGVACWAPAWRAARIDPARMLRAD